MNTIKIPKNKYEYFFYLTCGWDTQEIEGRIKDEDRVRYSAIKKIESAKVGKSIELTYDEWREVAGFLEDAIDIKKDHIGYDWKIQNQIALENYYCKYF